MHKRHGEQFDNLKDGKGKLKDGGKTVNVSPTAQTTCLFVIDSFLL